MLHRLCGPPSIPLSFSLAAVLPRRDAQCVSDANETVEVPSASIHRLQRGLPGYLILFAPHAFVHERQYRARGPLSPLVFLLISTNFTSTPGIPPPSPGLQTGSFDRSSEVEPRAFTTDLLVRLRTLYAQ